MSENIPSLYVVMPAYNEEANIEGVVRSWMPVLRFGSGDSRLVVADSGSVDNTHGILKELQKEFPQLEILENTRKEHGPKVSALYRHALEHGADYIFQTDSDGQTDPDEFELFWNMKDEHDFILGNRTERGDGASRAMVERVVCLLALLYFHVRIPDANAPFRLMKGEKLKKHLEIIPEDYALPNIILSSSFAKKKENLQFVPITFRPRTAGKNSINLKRIMGIGMQSLRDFSMFARKLNAS